ncbi:MAG TPA: arginine decarboxylase, partial [Anaerolineae bacterium]|nr:arginine decarboxylase [Anaerolineae bacterium]
HDGKLHFANIELLQFFHDNNTPIPSNLPSPLEIVYLPLIKQKIEAMRGYFTTAAQETNYPASFHYAYASKANAAEEVIRTTLGAGAHHEMSSTSDVDIAQLMIQRGLLPPDRMIISNGFKPANTAYAHKLHQLNQIHPNLIPVIESVDELSSFIASDQKFRLGLRQKSYGHNTTLDAMNAANSRFGLDLDGLLKANQYISAAPNLELIMLHGMVGSQILDPQEFVDRLTPSLETFAHLRRLAPSLHIFNFGGGMPVPMTLNFDFDYVDFFRRLLTTAQKICDRYDVPPPDIMGEFGRYTTTEHGAHIFKIITVKDNGSAKPWYIIDGSIMSSFPDSWALSEHFIVLPLNHLDQPFHQVQLGGITCDSDDVYPPKPSQSPLYLPTTTDDLYIGFFHIGAYQEMLGGVRGSKHCVLPEANEIILDHDDNGQLTFELIPGQTPEDVLYNLGYLDSPTSQPFAHRNV